MDDLKRAVMCTSSKVALVVCDSYDQGKVDAAVKTAVALLGGLEAIFTSARSGSKVSGEAAEHSINKDSRLLLKPNLLAKTSPEKACTTHPAVFEATGRLLQEAGYENLKYGDSPANPLLKVENTAAECGIKAAADKLGIPLGDFEHGTETKLSGARVNDAFVLCNEVMQADGIVNVCKMKTHQLTRITGAVKNTFGCVLGPNKAAFHARYATAETFAKMIVDLNRLVTPALHIMDGVVAMEGNGPHSGEPRAMNVILASVDPVALDGLFCHLVHLKPELVPTNVAGMEAGIGSYEKIEVCTVDGVLTVEEASARYGNADFSVQRSREYRGTMQALRILAPFLEKKPVVRTGACIGCGICVEACPVEGKAIHVKSCDGAARGSRVAQYDYAKCIKCYCCQEVCPEDAITVKKSLLARIADRRWRI